MAYDKNKFDKKPFNKDNRDDKKSWRREGYDKSDEDKPKRIIRTKSTKTDMFEDFAEFIFGENNERAADKYFSDDKNSEPRKVEFDKNKPRRERPAPKRNGPSHNQDNASDHKSDGENKETSEPTPVLPWQKGRNFGAEKSEDKDRFEKNDSWSRKQNSEEESKESPTFDNAEPPIDDKDSVTLPWEKKSFEKKAPRSPNRDIKNESRERPPSDSAALPWKKPPRKRSEPKPFEKEPLDVPNITRLNKYVAKTGLCSRRKAADLVKAGEIKVNGVVEINPAYEMQEDDVVEYNGTILIREEKLVYLLLNKPKGYITTMDDENDRKTVMDLVQDKIDVRAYPVGRLDRNTTGLLLITNDGDLAKKLSHPSHKVQKFYHVVLDKVVTEEHLQEIKDGLTLEDGPVEVDAVDYISGKLGNEVGVEIHLGRNRIVRRIFEHLGYTVEKLDRTYYAGLTKKDLSRGWSRELTKKEIIMLKHFTGS